MKLSVITVTFNAQNVLRETLNSLLRQTYRDYELIIVDGKSTDKTMSIVNDYREQFPTMQIICEKDCGIYDAMNKGISMADGEYVYFLNAGDVLWDSSVLEKVYIWMSRGCDLIYGDIVNEKGRKRYTDKINKLFFLQEKMICHQAIFVKRVYLTETLFNCKYKYCADRDWLYHLYKNKIEFTHIDCVIVRYDDNGVSSSIDDFQKDSINVIVDEFGMLGVLFVKIKRLCGRILKINENCGYTSI